MSRFKASDLRKAGVPIPPKAKDKERNVHHSTKTKPSTSLFDAACKAHDLPIPVYEWQFEKGRKWAFDYLFEGWLAIECVGGVWINGHHSRGQDQIDDMIKRNYAALRGYTVLEFPPEMFDDGSAFAFIKRVLSECEDRP